MQPLEPDDPQVIGEYRLLRRLGAGGMGRVYLARSASGRTVAVKVVHPHFSVDEEFRTRFRREVAAARRVGGEWTAPVLDADPDARVPWVATGYVAGPNLTQAVVEHGPLPEHSVRTLGAGLGEALRHVHGLDLVHRDVKPSNVLLTVDGPRLIDFGIARATDGTASLTSSGVSVGSPGYMSPEQVLGKGVESGSDVFSMGAVLAFAANGVAPFSGDNSAALLYKVVYEEPELDGLTGELRELISSCLAKEAADRPTPGEIAERFAGRAPAGAAGLVSAGWLPGPVVEQVGRSAVSLLSIEPEGPPAVPPPPTVPPSSGSPQSGSPQSGAAGGELASGPVPFTSASEGAGAGAGADSVTDTSSGVPQQPPPPPPTAQPSQSGQVPASGQVPVQGGFGPPDASYGRAAFGDSAADVPTGDLAGRPGSASGSGGPGPGGTGTGQGKGLRSSLVVGSRDTGGGKRQRGCTLVLVVATALAVVMVGGAFVFDLLPSPGGGDTSAQPPANEQSPSASAPVRKGDVPVDYLGTWEGPVKTRNGLTNGKLKINLRGGHEGEQILDMSVDVSAGDRDVVCRGTAKLDKATPKELRLTDKAVGKSPTVLGIKVCSDESAPLTLSLLDNGQLRYESRSEPAGRPTANLTRIGD